MEGTFRDEHNVYRRFSRTTFVEIRYARPARLNFPTFNGKLVYGSRPDATMGWYPLHFAAGGGALLTLCELVKQKANVPAASGMRRAGLSLLVLRGVLLLYRATGGCVGGVQGASYKIRDCASGRCKHVTAFLVLRCV